MATLRNVGYTWMLCLFGCVFGSVLITGCDDPVDMGNITDQIITVPTQPDVPAEMTYLTLRPGGDETLTPTNPPGEWRPDYLSIDGEKTRWGLYYDLITTEGSPEVEWVRTDTIHNRYNEVFEHWIYLHAPSEVVYDLRGSNYAAFDGYIGVADPWGETDPGCGHSGTMEFVFLIDDIGVYKTGRIVGIEQEAPIHVTFDLPADAETLTLVVTSAGDGIGCDHWMLGDARLLHR